MKNTSIKNLMIARNALTKLSNEEISELENELYTDKKVKCIDAIHIDEYENESETFTWFIPENLSFDIETGDTLVVEQVIGIGLAFVKVVRETYEMTKEEHEDNLHPYCPIISNLGKRL